MSRGLLVPGDGISSNPGGTSAARSRAEARATNTTSSLLLLASNGRLGYRVLRCAARVYSRVIVLGSHDESPWPTEYLAQSRYCSRFVRANSPIQDRRTVEQVNEIAREQKDLLVAAADLPAARFLADFGHLLCAATAPTPDADALRRLATKDAFAQFCAAADLPHPGTVVAASAAELGRILSAASPDRRFVLKPLDQDAGSGVHIISAGRPDWRDLGYAPILVQEFVPGEDVSASAACLEGQVVIFQAYRHVFKRRFGRSIRARMEFFDFPLFRDLVSRAAASCGLNGIVNFDARLTPRGELILIECNPRPWYNIHLAMLAGVNFTKFWDPRLRGSRNEPVRSRLPVAPGGVVAFESGLPRAHLQHIASDAWYYLSVDLRQWAGLSRESAKRR